MQRWRATAPALRCPVCGDAFTATDAGLCCPAGHGFDRARQGYVAVLSGRRRELRSDTADMVAARRRTLDGGLFEPVAAAIAGAVAPSSALVVDAGAGTGYYLAAALDAAPTATGVGIDLSKYCARATARAHPRALSLLADLWAGLPLGDDTADAVLSVFAPRNPAEVARILTPGGRWLLVTPEPGHLHQVREPLGMLDIGADKLTRLHDDLAAHGFAVDEVVPVTSTSTLEPAGLADLAGMGPAGFHRSAEEFAVAAGELGPTEVTVEVSLTVATRGPGL